MRLQHVSIDRVIADPRCQSRTGIDRALVHEYAEAITEGAELPPLSTIDTGDGYLLYDGFHRLEAYRQAGTTHVVIEAEPGDVWDAIERSCRVNAIHGKRRTNADKHRAVETMIRVMEHKGENWPANEIASRCAVSHTLVTNSDAYLSFKERCDRPVKVTRNGTTYNMNTANIGRRTYRAPDIAAQLATTAEDVDEDTGEILDDAPPYEEVDASDPATWFTPAPQPTTPAPAPRAEQRTITLTYRDYGPDHRRLSARSLALELDAEFGDGFARMVGQEAS